MDTLKNVSNKNAIAFLVTVALCWYIYRTPGCESVMNAYLTGMFGIATGYAIGKMENGTKV